MHPQSLLDLPPGEARESLLAVHGMLEARLPPNDLAIYEAGGGSTSFLPLSVLRRAHVTVVDIDENQIRNNDYAQEKILGDIQTYRFKPDSFDLVICYNVIEHLPDVEAALLGFCESLKRGGLILIGAPNPKSLSGVVTQLYAALVPRLVLPLCARRQEGRPARRSPVPDLLPSAGHACESRGVCEGHGLQVIYRKAYESPRFPELRLRKPMLAALLDAAAAALNFVLPDKTEVRHGDYHVILRKL